MPTRVAGMKEIGWNVYMVDNIDLYLTKSKMNKKF